MRPPLVGLLRACVLSAGACLVAAAQEPDRSFAQLYHASWGLREGAPAEVFALAQSRDGVLWLGTSTGLIRFDGVQFEPYEVPSGQAMPSANVSALQATPDGTLYVGYRFGGASRIAGGRITNYGVADGLPAGSILHFAHDSSGVVWAATTRGLFALRGERWIGATLNPTFVSSVMTDVRGRLWAATSVGLLVRERGDTTFQLRYPLNGFHFGWQLAAAPDGGVWASSDGGVVVQLADATGLVVPRVRHTPDLASAAIHVDRTSHLWYSVPNGIARVHLERRRGGPGDAAVEERVLRTDGLSGTLAVEFLEDREHNLWVATNGGLDEFRPTRLMAAPQPASLPALVACPTGAVFAGRLMSPLVRMDDGARVVASTLVDVQAGFCDADGSLWAGGQARLWHREGARITEVALPRFNGAMIQALTRDSAGDLWMSVTANGVFRRDANGWHAYGDVPDLPRLTAITIVADRAGHPWFGYTADRVAWYDGRATHLFTAAQGLAVGNVTAIRPGRTDTWIGGEFGLMRRTGERFVTIRGTGDVPFRGVSGLVERANGDLWINGADGITRIANGELARARADTSYRVRFERFDVRDGLEGAASQIRPLPSAVEARDGRLWFATSTRVFWIDPEQIPHNDVPPPVVVRALVAGDARYPLADTVVLPPRTTSLDIRYTALSLAIPERVRFRHRLVGGDTNWRDVGGRREAHFTNLAPGTYRFEVRASNEDGVWNLQGASQLFVIPPTFTQTNLFLLLCLLVMVGVAWGLYQVRVRSVAADLRRRYQERLTERTRIAQDLHDTLLQGFTGITLQLQGVQHSIADAPETASGALAQILNQADAALREARHAVWDMRAPELDARDLPGALEAAARAAVAGTDLDFRFTCTGLRRRLSPVVEIAALRIGREAVVNAVTHANARRLELELCFGATTLEVRVTDDGLGLGLATADRAEASGHWGLSGMRERAQSAGGTLDIVSTPDRGTAVRASFPIGRER